MRLTIILTGITFILIVFFAAAGDIFESVMCFFMMYFHFESMYLKSKNIRLKKCEKIVNEMTTDELAEIKCRMKADESKN